MIPSAAAQEFLNAVAAGYDPNAGFRVSGAVSFPDANGDYQINPGAVIQNAGHRVWRSLAHPSYWLFWDDDGWGIQINETDDFVRYGGQIYFADFADLTLGDMVPWLYNQPQNWLLSSTDSTHEALTITVQLQAGL